jgi:hypothetical protein
MHRQLRLHDMTPRGHVSGVEELKAIGVISTARTRRSPGTDLGTCFIAR